MGYVIDEGSKRKSDTAGNQQTTRLNKASGESCEYESIKRSTFADHSKKDDKSDDGE